MNTIDAERHDDAAVLEADGFRRERDECKARRAPKTGAYTEVREDLGVAQRRNRPAQQKSTRLLIGRR